MGNRWLMILVVKKGETQKRGKNDGIVRGFEEL